MSTGKQKTIDDYFCCPSRKQPRPEDSAIPAATSEDLPMIVETASHSALQTENIDEEPDISMPWNDFSEENSPTTSSINQPVAGNAAQTADLLDVGRLLSAYGPTPTNIPDDLKMKLLKTPLRPSAKATFPQRNFGKSGKRSFYATWLLQYPWLAYSFAFDGCLCVPCYLFAVRLERLHTRGAALVEVLFCDWKHAIAAFNAHQSNEYHKNAQKSAMDFESLPKIVTAVMFCGQQCIALRGHRDENGPITQDKPSSNDGNFRNLIRLMKAIGDPGWVDQFEKMPKNALYTSPKAQNEFAEAIGELITESILKEVKTAGYYSVLADEVQDCTWAEQLSISLRYVDMESIEVKERFIRFVDVKEMTGQSYRLDIEKCVGIGMDGAANMAGKYRGAAAIIRTQLPKAIYIHCSNHVVNLAVCNASKVALVKQLLFVVNNVTWFLKPRHDIVQHFIRLYLPNSRWESCITFCETRWVEKHDCLIRFKELYKVIFSSLEVIGKKKPEAVGFCSAMETFEFAYALCLVTEISGLLLPVSMQLQSPSLDLLGCLAHIDEISELIDVKKKNANAEWNALMEAAVALLRNIQKTAVVVQAESTAMSLFGLEEEELEENNVSLSFAADVYDPRPKIPKAARRGPNAYMPPEDYYLSNVSLPYINELQKQLGERFLAHRNTCARLQAIIPATLGSFDDLREALALYESEVSSVETLKQQFELWKLRFQKTTQRPSTAIDALTENFTFLPDIKVLLQIFATIPVSTATPERSNSTLKRLKTYLRSTLTQDRMNALALMYVYRNSNISAEDVVQHWYQKKNRRL